LHSHQGAQILNIEVKIELPRVGAQPHGVQLVLSLVLQPDLQDIAGEHAVLQKELVALF